MQAVMPYWLLAGTNALPALREGGKISDFPKRDILIEKLINILLNERCVITRELITYLNVSKGSFHSFLAVKAIKNFLLTLYHTF